MPRCSFFFISSVSSSVLDNVKEKRNFCFPLEDFDLRTGSKVQTNQLTDIFTFRSILLTRLKKYWLRQKHHSLGGETKPKLWYRTSYSHELQDFFQIVAEHHPGQRSWYPYWSWLKLSGALGGDHKFKWMNPHSSLPQKLRVNSLIPPCWEVLRDFQSRFNHNKRQHGLIQNTLKRSDGVHCRVEGLGWGLKERLP